MIPPPNLSERDDLLACQEPGDQRVAWRRRDPTSAARGLKTGLGRHGDLLPFAREGPAVRIPLPTARSHVQIRGELMDSAWWDLAFPVLASWMSSCWPTQRRYTRAKVRNTQRS